MIRAFYGIEVNPFSHDQEITLLKHQQEVYDILKVHSYQGGFCLLMGEPGTGKTIIKNTIRQNTDKRTKVVNISRTLHTYLSIVKILCDAFKIDEQGIAHKCEKRLIEEAYNLNSKGIALIIIIDDAHLLEINALRKLRLLFEDFPKNHNVILVGQVELIHKLCLKVNEDIKSRVTYSTLLKRLNPDDMEEFLYKQLDIAGLPHNTFTEEAMALIVRSSDGFLRIARNLALSCLLEAVRRRIKTIDLDNVNHILIQPHWRIESDVELIRKNELN
jgi:MSHA biogenesis protein MshM